VPKHVAVYGTNPQGYEKRIYALYCPVGMETTYIERAEAEGWSNLIAEKQPHPVLFEDQTTDSSASSAKPSSPTTKRRRSGTSGAA
jgi:hypothetical protein